MQHYRTEDYQVRTSIGYLVRRAAALIVEQLEPAVAQHGLTYTQWVVLMHLRDGIATNPRDICSQLRHDSGALTRVIDHLEERGLLQRQRSLEDRREVALHLTEAGSKMVEGLIPALVEKLNWALRDFSGGEVAQLTRLLTKLVVHLADRGPEPARDAK